MKIEEVPQDDKYLGGTTIRDTCYALDENGEYRQAYSVGWEAKNEALSLTWDAISEDAEIVRREALAGRKSPLAYHMETHLFDVGLLAAYAGISRRTVRKHMKPDEFEKVDESTLTAYASALNMSVEELKKV